MDAEPSLSEENARLLDQAADSTGSIGEHCRAGIALAQKWDEATGYIVQTVDDALDQSVHTIRDILSKPDLLPWMDGNDRADLADLTRDFTQCVTDREEALCSPHDNPYGAYGSFFHDVHCATGMAATLFRATRGSLRHRLRATPSSDLPPVPPPSVPIHIRWMIRKDMPTALQIDRESFEEPWHEEDFLLAVRARQCIPSVAVRDDERVVGFMVYEIHNAMIHMVRFAVPPAERRQGIGSMMVQNLLGKLPLAQRRRLLVSATDPCLFSQPSFYARQQLNAVAALPLGGEQGHLLEHRTSCARSMLLTQEGAAQELPSIPSTAHENFWDVTEWDPDEIPPWKPDDLGNHDIYGLWDNEEENND